MDKGRPSAAAGILRGPGTDSRTFQETMTEKEFMMDDRYRIVLCGANTYDKKYYFNRKFDKIPENIKEELHIICVLFTEEAGGIFTIGFTPTGKVVMDSTCDEGDLLYDDIGSGLLMKKIRQSKQELFQALQVYYKVTFLHMEPGDVLAEDEETGSDEIQDSVGRAGVTH